MWDWSAKWTTRVIISKLFQGIHREYERSEQSVEYEVNHNDK